MSCIAVNLPSTVSCLTVASCTGSCFKNISISTKYEVLYSSKPTKYEVLYSSKPTKYEVLYSSKPTKYRVLFDSSRCCLRLLYSGHEMTKKRGTQLSNIIRRQLYPYRGVRYICKEKMIPSAQQ